MARRYPSGPVVGVAGVVLDGDRLLLVRRGREPAKGIWSLPGGVLRLGESLKDGCAREVREETGISVEVGPLVHVAERVLRDQEGKVEYHYVILDYLCLGRGGELRAGDDAEKARWVALDEPEQWDLNQEARRVVQKALALRDAADRGREAGD